MWVVMRVEAHLQAYDSRVWLYFRGGAGVAGGGIMVDRALLCLERHSAPLPELISGDEVSEMRLRAGIEVVV